MPKVRPVSPKTIEKLLFRLGYTEVKCGNGSHRKYKKEGSQFPIIIPFHSSKELARGTLNDIINDLALNEGMTKEQVKEMLQSI